MRMRRVIIAVLLSAAFVTAAVADTYTCTEVDRRAKLAYDGSAKVSVVGKDKVCTFSIGERRLIVSRAPRTLRQNGLTGR